MVGELRRTAQLIEAQKEVLSAVGSVKKQKKRPRGKAFAPGNEHRFKPGESGNPSGKPGTDLAALMARRIFEQHGEGIAEGLRAQLEKGNAYAFNVLADRGYGKVKETQQIEHTGKDGAPLQIIVELVDGSK